MLNVIIKREIAKFGQNKRKIIYNIYSSSKNKNYNESNTLFLVADTSDINAMDEGFLSLSLTRSIPVWTVKITVTNYI